MNKSAKFWDRLAKYNAKQEQNIQLTDNKDYVSTLKYLNINDVVLDYGCGAGILSNAVAAKVKEIQAIDISSKMIEAAKRKASEGNIENINYRQATIFDESYQKESFNVILAFNILHLLEDIQNVIHRISELLIPGGLLISATPCLGQKGTFLRILLYLTNKVRVTPYVRFLKTSELDSLVVSGGLQIVETEILSENPPHYFVVARKM